MLDGLYQGSYWLSRFIIQRGLGFIYLVAFVVALNQFRPLLGTDGLLPVPRFLERVSFKKAPSIFHWHYSDHFFAAVAWTGIVLSVIATSGLSGAGPLWISMIIWFLLWLLYLSIVNVGQLFYGFGWESLLLEAGFYAIFLGPLHYHAPVLMIFVIRWLVFRVEFGAGLIKMRGDQCWRDLTCMNYHHETQPMPNPLSRYFHLLPESLHKLETFFNHLVQLGAVWLLFFPQPAATIGALFIIVSQCYLIISGNYAWLNWMTLIIAFSGISDAYLSTVIPIAIPGQLVTPFPFEIIAITITVIVAYMSINPIKNMISSNQRMNASFNSLHLVNTYGAFGSVTRKRYEIIIEGTSDSTITPETKWEAYEFKGKPGNPARLPPQFAPYHLRLDWQIWFAAMSTIRTNPWLLRFIFKLLQNDRKSIALLKENPFKDNAPKYIRARLFRYKYADRKERKRTGKWWKRQFEHMYLPPQSLEDLKSVRF